MTTKLFTTDIHQRENELRSDSSKLSDEQLINLREHSQYPQLSLPPESTNWVLAESNKKVDIVPICHFTKRFALATKGATSYLNWENIVVAGGSVSNALNGALSNDQLATDTDIFIYGCDQQKADKVVVEIIREITNYFDRLDTKQYAFKMKYQMRRQKYSKTAKRQEDDDDCTESESEDVNSYSDKEMGWSSDSCLVVKNQHVISIIPRSMQLRAHKVQIILRIYKNVHEILAGFDVDSCAVAYDGMVVSATERALQSFKSGYNLVDLTRRSPSYEHRLFKYHQRGFGILVPFEYSGYNQLYFLNRQCHGLDRLIYLLKMNNSYRLKTFLYKVTGRKIAIKYGQKPSNYEGVSEFDTNAKNLTKNLERFNATVGPEFRYSILNGEKITRLKYMLDNPGQQLTGSFNPITSGDWIKVDYSQFGLDHLGRSLVLNSIRQNTYDLSSLYDKTILDESYFNQLHLLIVYSKNIDDIITAWNNRKRIPNQIPNTYRMEYFITAVLLGRASLVNVVIQDLLKEQLHQDLERLVDAIVFMDNTELMTLATKWLSDQPYLHKSKIRDLCNQYHSQKIQDQMFITKRTERTKSPQDQLIEMTPLERTEQMLHGAAGYNFKQTAFWSERLVELLTHQDLFSIKTHLNKDQAKTHFTPFLKCVITLDPNINDEMYYDSFEQHFLKLAFQNEQKLEQDKSTAAHDNAYLLLTNYFGIKTKEFSLSRTIDHSYLSRYQPTTLHIIRTIYGGDATLNDYLLRYGQKSIDLRAQQQVRDYIFQTDHLEALKILIPDDYLIRFLSEYPHYLPNSMIANYLEELKCRSLTMDDLHRNLAEPFNNTEDHLEAVEKGVLREGYRRAENTFGLTPDDYIINTVLSLYSKYHPELTERDVYSRRRSRRRRYYESDSDSEDEKVRTSSTKISVTESDLSLLNNIRQSVLNIKRDEPIETTTILQASRPCLAELFSN